MGTKAPVPAPEVINLHERYAALARAYKLEQHGITGICRTCNGKGYIGHLWWKRRCPAECIGHGLCVNMDHCPPMPPARKNGKNRIVEAVAEALNEQARGKRTRA